MNKSVASRKNHVSDMFFNIGFMSYFLSSNSPLSSNRDRNYVSALVALNQHKEKRYNSIFLKNTSRKNHITSLFPVKYYYLLVGVPIARKNMLFRLVFISIHRCSIALNLICLDSKYRCKTKKSIYSK